MAATSPVRFPALKRARVFLTLPSDSEEDVAAVGEVNVEVVEPVETDPLYPLGASEDPDTAETEVWEFESVGHGFSSDENDIQNFDRAMGQQSQGLEAEAADHGRTNRPENHTATIGEPVKQGDADAGAGPPPQWQNHPLSCLCPICVEFLLNSAEENELSDSISSLSISSQTSSSSASSS